MRTKNLISVSCFPFPSVALLLSVMCSLVTVQSALGDDHETPVSEAGAAKTKDPVAKRKKPLSLVPPSFKRTDPLPYVKVPEPSKPDPMRGRFMDQNMDDLHPGRPPRNFNPGDSQAYPGNFLPK